MQPHEESQRYWNNRFRKIRETDTPSDASHIRRVYTSKGAVETAEEILRENYEQAQNGKTENNDSAGDAKAAAA
jgi:hypothetical protein